MPDRDDAVRLTPQEALARLVEGNRRFVAGEPERPDQTRDRRAALGDGQHPFALVLSCADSRVPPELVFDAGLGDLFVVRSAGHVLDHAILGTLEFGVEQIGTPVVVVLGHTGCGAVKATLQARSAHAAASGTDIDTLLEAIAPAVAEAEREVAWTPDVPDAVPTAILDLAVKHHVERVVADVRVAPLVAPATARGAVLVVGGVYDLATGRVDLTVLPDGADDGRAVLAVTPPRRAAAASGRAACGPARPGSGGGRRGSGPG
jgi:carbonic anhydrase